LSREAIRDSMGSTDGVSTQGLMMRVMLTAVLLMSALLLLTPGFWAVTGVLCELAFLLVQTTGKILWATTCSLGRVRRRRQTTPLSFPPVKGQEAKALAPAPVRPLRSPTRPP
jgi:hypothetical protein